MRGGHRTAYSSSGADPGIFRKERLAKAQRNERNIPPLPGKKRHSRFRRIHSHPLLKRILREEQVVVVDVNLIAAPAEIIAEVTGKGAFDRYVGCVRCNGHIISVHRGERAVEIGSVGTEEPIMI